MDQPLGVRLGAEALGTFLFFFLGFSGIAVVGRHRRRRDHTARHRGGVRFRARAGDHGLRTSLRRTLQPRGHAGVAVAGRFPARDVIPYWIAQLVGGFGAVLVMAIVYSSDVTDALHTAPGSGIDDWAALVLEIIATALFVMVILTVATDERAAWNGVMAPFLIGLFIFTAARHGRPGVRWIVQSRALTRSRSLQPGVGRRLDLHRRPARRRSARRRDLGVRLPPGAADSGSRIRDRSSGRAARARDDASLAAAGREVLVVLDGRPAAAPTPPDRVERAHEGPALVRHPGPARPAVEVGNARAV